MIAANQKSERAAFSCEDTGRSHDS